MQDATIHFCVSICLQSATISAARVFDLRPILQHRNHKYANKLKGMLYSLCRMLYIY
jgi:hypothetical protein